MVYPKHVYVIFPFDQTGLIAGAYIGNSYNVEERIKCHKGCYSKVGKEEQLHNLMRKNGFVYFILDTIKNCRENHKEYDWMDYFIKVVGIPLFNNRIGFCGADWHRIGGESS